MDSPRGRIVLMGAALDEADAISDAMATHWDRCLGCMACVTACPSGVRYDQLIEDTRPQVERNYRARVRRRGSCGARLRRVHAPGPAARAGSARAGASVLGARRIGRALPDGSRLGAVLRLTPRGHVRPGHVPDSTPATGGTARARGAPSRLCPARLLRRRERATARGARRRGLGGRRAPNAPAAAARSCFTRGYEEEGLALARATDRGLRGLRHVVANAAGCGSADEGLRPAARRRARLGRACRGCRATVTESPSSAPPSLGPRAARRASGRLPRRVPPRARAGVRAEPRALLAGIPGLSSSSRPNGSSAAAPPASTTSCEPEAAAELRPPQGGEPARDRCRRDRRREPRLRAPARHVPRGGAAAACRSSIRSSSSPLDRRVT